VPSPPVTDDNWHIVEQADLRVFDAAEGGAAYPMRAVRLRSYEGGRPYARVFPAARTFQPGEYVSWDWDMTSAVPEAWVETSSSHREYAWTSSASFAGKHLAKRSDAHLAELHLRPTAVRLRPGERAPVRVIAFYRDGPACWRKDVTAEAALATSDPDVLAVAGEGLFAKRAGSTQLFARFGGLYAMAQVTVAAITTGTVVEWFGGHRRIVGLLQQPDGLLLALQRECLLRVRPDMGVEQVASVEMPDTSSTGLDTMAADPEGNLYVRTLWDRRVLKLSRRSNFSESAVVMTADGQSAVMALAWSTQGGGLLVADSRGDIQLFRAGQPAMPWIQLPHSAIGLAARDDTVYVLLGGGRFPGYGEVRGQQRAYWSVLPKNLPVAPTALLPRKDDVLLAGGDGRVYSVRSLRAEVFAEGFTSPQSLAEDDQGCVFVANFGGDSVSRVLP
jgi:hypothetical protein